MNPDLSGQSNLQARSLHLTTAGSSFAMKLPHPDKSGFAMIQKVITQCYKRIKYHPLSELAYHAYVLATYYI